MTTSTGLKLFRIARGPHRHFPFLAIAAFAVAIAANRAAAQHEGHDDHAGEKAPHGTAGPHAEKSPFEWGGVYELPAGVTDLVIQPGPDASIDIALVAVADGSDAAFTAAAEEAERVFAGHAKPITPGEEFTPGSEFYQLRVEGQSAMRFKVRATRAGRYALFTQHFADEFQTIFETSGATGQKVFPQAMRNFVDRFGQIVIQPAAVKAFGVKLDTAALRTLVPSFTAPARVAYNTERMAHIGSAVVGRVAALPVRQGDTVKEGDTLLVVDSPELGEAQSDYVQKRTMAHAAAPIVELTKSAAERAKKLYDESEGISLTEVQKRLAEQQTAESALLNARAAMTGASNRLQLLGMSETEIKTLGETGTITPRYTVRSPIGGRVIRRDVTLGELVRPDRDSLLVVADTSRLWVLVDVPEMRLKDVAVGSAARISVAAFPGESFEGSVSFISADLNEATRTAQVRVEVDNAQGTLRPGLFARAEIIGASSGSEGGTSAGVLAVPESAIQMIEGKPVVFVPFTEKANTFLKRPVTVGEAVGGMLPVLYGLREGEPIVIAATFILKAELGKSSAKHEH
ncbi:MAG: efflux RND transporter periplasmic adaptor subunit [Phycisphaerae bacterium]|nr:efflux RND transporter periplasmic adaptor subunit [Phycisphaerae bacterium]